MSVALERVAPLPESLIAYLDYIEAAGRSHQTFVSYRRVLSRFLARPNHADRLDVMDFLETFPSFNTRSTVIVILRQFYKFLIKRGLATEDPTRGLPIPQAKRRRWPLVTEEEFTSACRFLDEQMTILAIVLLRVGSRAGETCAMKPEHIVFDGDFGVIDFPCRKGGEAGFAAFGPAVAQVLRPLIQTSSEWVFPLTSRPEKHISPGQVRNELWRAGRKANTPAPFIPHRLRHTYITNAVDSGWSQLALQQQVGHRNANSTAWYYKPTRQGLLKALKATIGGSA